MRCIVWPEQFAHYEHLIQPDAIVVIRGAVDKRPGSEEANFIVNEVIPLEDLPSRYTAACRFASPKPSTGRRSSINFTRFSAVTRAVAAWNS